MHRVIFARKRTHIFHLIEKSERTEINEVDSIDDGKIDQQKAGKCSNVKAGSFKIKNS